MWNNHSCEREADVRQMARGGADDPAMREHAAGCAACRETLAVAAWMQELAAIQMDRPLPDPTYLWWKAELLRQWDAERRAAAPLERGEPVQVGIGLLGAMVLLVWLLREAPRLTTGASGVGVWGSTFTMTAMVGVVLLVVIAIVSIRDSVLRD